MSLFSILGTSRQNLQAHKARTAIASDNIANASTPGFSRRRANLEAMPEFVMGGARVGAGVNLNGVFGVRDRFLEAEVASTTARAGFSRAEAESLTALRIFDADAPEGAMMALDAFYSSLRDLQANPENLSARQAVLSAGQRLAAAVQTSAAQTAGTRAAIDQSLVAETGEVNQLTSEIAALNRDIVIALNSGDQPNALLDQRRVVAERLSELTGADTLLDEDGNLNAFLEDGSSLVNGQSAATLTTQPSATNRGHLDVVLTSASGTARVLAGGDIGGQMGGQLAARDVTLRDVSDGLDSFAFEFANAFNAIHSAGFGSDGVSGRDFFAPPTGLQGAAQNLAVALTDPRGVAAASVAGAPGDTSNLQGLIDSEFGALASGDDPRGTLNQIASRFGGQTQRALAAEEQALTLHARLNQMRDSVSGVSVDEELIVLTEAQRAFEAVSKVITTTDTMLEMVVNLKR